MDVQVVDALASLNAVVDDDPEPLVQLLLLRDLLRGVQEVAEELFVTLLRLAELRQAAADLGDDQKVGLVPRAALRGVAALGDRRQLAPELVDLRVGLAEPSLALGLHLRHDGGGIAVVVACTFVGDSGCRGTWCS